MYFVLVLATKLNINKNALQENLTRILRCFSNVSDLVGNQVDDGTMIMTHKYT